MNKLLFEILLFLPVAAVGQTKSQKADLTNYWLNEINNDIESDSITIPPIQPLSPLLFPYKTAPDKIKRNLFNSRLFNQIHDSIQIRLPKIPEIPLTKSYGYGERSLRLNWLLKQKIKLSGGRALTDFKGNNGIENENTTKYSNYYKSNFENFTEIRDINIQLDTKLAKRVTLGLGYDLQKRIRSSSLIATDQLPYSGTFLSESLIGTSSSSSDNLYNQNAGFFSAGIRYDPKLHKRSGSGQELGGYSSLPSVRVTYKKGIKYLLNSQTNYQLLKLNISQTIKMGHNSYLHYAIENGWFLAHTPKSNLADLAGFQLNNSTDLAGSLMEFNLPGSLFYLNSQDNLKVHLYYDSSNLLLSRLAFFKHSNSHEIFGFNYMETNYNDYYYWELGYTVTNLLGLFNFGAYSGKDPVLNKSLQFGFKITLNLDKLSKHKKYVGF